MTTKYLSVERLRQLQDNVGFLDNYDGPSKDELHVVGPSIENHDPKLSKELRELGILNNRRKELIKRLIGSDPKEDNSLPKELQNLSSEKLTNEEFRDYVKCYYADPESYSIDKDSSYFKAIKAAYEGYITYTDYLNTYN